ncbi:MAG: YeeE/YedE family protein [Myxococcales bacterium]|nr:YeeE/YedE family protein [Myxococcales bacterium]
MRDVVIGVGSGALFGVGLGISGMTLPSKVAGFLDFFGAWEPSLAFVMAGAVIVHAIAYRVIVRSRSEPIWGEGFRLPARADIDVSLVAGAAIFGVGWGLGGYCPGPALVSLATLGAPALVFVLAMTAGMLVQNAQADRASRPPNGASDPPPRKLEGAST